MRRKAPFVVNEGIDEETLNGIGWAVAGCDLALRGAGSGGVM
jgi:hypothetical protein